VVYGVKADDRLSPADWVAAGLRALKNSGFKALNAGGLARKLNVSRGSFYWHFADVGAFHDAVLARWRALALETIIENLEKQGGDRLKALMLRALEEPEALEVAIRAWAVAEPRARDAVASVDNARQRYIAELLIAAGVSTPWAATRARLIYYTYLGRAFSHERLDSEELRRIVDDLALLAIAPEA
jgi:AcrR family transcriptional regulator